MRLRTHQTYGSLIPPTDLMSVSVLSWPLVRSARAHTEGTCISSGDERRPPPLPECQPVQSACQIGSIPHGPRAAIRAAESTLKSLNASRSAAPHNLSECNSRVLPQD